MEKESTRVRSQGVQIVLISSAFDSYEDCAAWIERQAKFGTFTSTPIIYRRRFRDKYVHYAAERYSMYNKKHVDLWRADQDAVKEDDECNFLTSIYESSLVPMPTNYPVTA